jgi:hypothetical protein
VETVLSSSDLASGHIMRSAFFALRLGSAALLVTGLAACADRQDSVAGVPDGAANGLYPQIVVSGSKSSMVEVRLSLLTKPAGVMLGSYQGELTYDPQAVRIDRASLPSTVEGALNAEVPGRIRFVATSLDGFGGGPVLTVQFRRTGEIKGEAFTVVFEEVSAATDLSDLTGMVSGNPIISVN